jgi:hypothetical protein
MKPKDRDEITGRLFDDLAPPAPPSELRSRVLAAARTVAAEEMTADLWTRIWENRWLRVIWATSVVALVVGHVALVPHRPSTPLLTAEMYLDEGMAEFLRPIRIEASATPKVGRAGEKAGRLVEPNHGGNEL